MAKHFEILIDASGSMGYMKGSKEYENKYLLPDKSTRTSLVKKIINESLLDLLSISDSIQISTFRDTDKSDLKGEKIIKSRVVLDKNGKKIKQNYYDYFFDLKQIFKGKYNKNLIINYVNKIVDPDIGGTPLCKALTVTLDKIENKTNIIILSDGDANDKVNFDEEIAKLIIEKNIDCTVFFIGIDQDESAQKKSKNLAEFTNGKYVNVKAINYDKKLFDNFLFEVKTSITQNAIAAAVTQNTPVPKTQVQDKSSVFKEEASNEKPKEKEDEKKPEVNSNIEGNKLEKEVANNSKSLKLISDQLQTISSQVGYLSKAINASELDEFVNSDENEELNKQTGHQCEKLLFDKFKTFNWNGLEWLNQNQEQFKPYDFTVSKNYETIYIECKGTRSDSIEFALTKDEWIFYLNNKPNYRLYFVKDIIGQQLEVYRFNDLLSSIENQELLPFSSVNRKVKADRIWFKVNNKELWSH
jgi:hypothetical protein